MAMSWENDLEMELTHGSNVSSTGALAVFSHRDYTIGWICALPPELSAAKAMLDSIHPVLPNLGNDQNTYTLGDMGVHNIVIACMSSGVYGMTSATRVMSQMNSSFPYIRFILVVGVGGGVPQPHTDIRLGDVVVSHPTANFGGVIQYDYGKTVQEGSLQRLGVLNKPPEVLLTAISSLRANHYMKPSCIPEHLSRMAITHPTMVSEFICPPQQTDRLFEADYEHEELESTCDKGDSERLVKRSPRAENQPNIHYGSIASANQVMKHAATRDKLARELGILCFEMEAGGLMDNFPCLIIRGICDYADSHKNKQWQGYAAATAAAYAKELLSIVPAHGHHLSPATRHSPNTLVNRWRNSVCQTHPDPPFVLPFRRDPDFIDRPILNQILHQALEPGARIGLVGLGGIGKSQIAIEYAYRIRNINPSISVLWVHASSVARFEESFRKIATHLQLPEYKDSKVDILGTVYMWLSEGKNGRWTMIVDNADDADVLFSLWNGANTSTVNLHNRPLSEFLPVTRNGSILITSRNQDVVRRLQVHIDDILEIEPMEVDTAENLLLKKLKKGRHPSSDESKHLVVQLDCMPLAISQAAGYIDQCAPRMNVSRYITMLENNDNNRATLLQSDVSDPRRDREASNSIVKTWYVTFTHLRQMRDSAARLLALMSVFDREAIPEYLLQGRYMRVSGSEAEFEKDIATLRAYSLINISESGDQFNMHRLVQLSTQKWFDMHQELVDWQERLIDIIDSVPLSGSGYHSNWKTCQMMFPHIKLMWTYRVLSQPHLKKWATCLYDGSFYAWEMGQYDIAEKMIRASLEVRQKLLGADDTATLASINLLALTLLDQGKYSEPGEISRHALAGYMRVLGLDHADTLTCMNNFATALRDQGKYSEAEEINRQVLPGYEKLLGADHPYTLTSVSNLVLVLRDQGKYTEAGEMDWQVLKKYEKVFGPEHPNMLTSMNNFATALRDQRKFSEAEDIHRQALAGYQKIFGLDHPYTLTSTNNLGLVLRDQSKYTEAEEMNRRALAGYEKVLGLDHPDTLNSINCLAHLYSAMGRHRDALDLYDRAINGYNRVLGPDHPTTLACLNYGRLLTERNMDVD